jgi:GntR family transcriptional regulator
MLETSPAGDAGTAAGMRGQREPKYWALKQHLLDLLDALPPGSPIPTERALAGEFTVSRTTVRQALADLTAEGRLHRVQGKGTFAAEPKLAQRLQLSSYTEDMRKQGLKPSSKLLEVEELAVEGELSKLLAIRAGAKILRLRRLRLADSQPMALETTHLPLGRFRGLRKHITAGGSLYAVLREHYGVELERAEETIETSLAGPQEAEMLGADVGMPVLMLTRHSFATDGKPVEFARAIYRGDRYKFVTTLLP